MSNGDPEKEMRKELIEDYFLEISDPLGSENLRTEIDYSNSELYSAKVEIDLSCLNTEEEWNQLFMGLRSIIRRIVILEYAPDIKISVQMSGLHRNK
ncbi:MAG TPA: hypothetical protein VHD83_05860 [Puia sp.]|nr:hypothetical protein [Puia sp.]